MRNGSECNPGGCHGLQSRCLDENWEVGSIPTRFRKNYIFFLILSFIFFSFIFSQGMYIEKNDNSVYSFNIIFDSFRESKDINNDGIMDDNIKDYYGLSLSTVIKGNNEFSLGYKEGTNSKIFNTSYSYYIKPNLYFNFFVGPTYEYIKKDLNITENRYSVKLGIYGKKRNVSSNNTALQYFPFFIYDYVLHQISINENFGQCAECYYDILTIGCSFLFNDIGIEPSYSWIDRNTNKFQLKVYLWEFGN